MSSVINESPAVRAFHERLEQMRGSFAYRNYLAVRDRVLEMQAQSAALPGGTPSIYWQEELANFDYLFDASPLIVEKLRHHSFHVTGLRTYDYRRNRDKFRDQIIDKLRALLGEGPGELLVPEARQMGGFGFEYKGQLFNLDTLKFFEVLIALERGGVLGDFRGTAERRLVWEIGAGWGGFPYQFKTLCPNVTYVITDLPELFLFSATYLMTLFPDARVRFWGEEPAAETFAHWREYDFIFMPNTALAELTPDRMDLAVNMVSFQEMTAAQVQGYVDRAYALNCPFLYSLNREKSAYNDEIESVTAIISKLYWPKEVPILPIGYTKMMGEKPSANEYKHVVGWRRIKT